MQLLGSYGFEQYVTRSTHNLGGLLDVVIARRGVVGETLEVVDVGLSDHWCVFWSIDVSRPTPVYRSVECRNWKCFDIQSFSNDLAQTILCDCVPPASDGCDVVITMTKQYDDILCELVARHAVQRTLSLRRRPSDMWFDS